MSVPAYPRDRSTCMSKDGPTDHCFHIPGGTLLYKPQRDVRFPYIYKIPTHALVHSGNYIKTILIHIMDTSIDAREARAKYEGMLSVPLGPNANMDNYGQFTNSILFSELFIFIFVFCYGIAGLFKLEPGTILFARPLTDDGLYNEENDIAEAWCLDG